MGIKNRFRRLKRRLAKDQKYDARLIMQRKELDELKEWAIKEMERREKNKTLTPLEATILGDIYSSESEATVKKLFELDKKRGQGDKRQAIFKITDSKGNTLGFSSIETTKNGKAYSDLVYIAPEYRKEGLSNKLLRAQENLFLSKRHDEIVLRVFNPELKKSLKKQGYEILEAKDVLQNKELSLYAPEVGHGFLAVKKKKKK